MPHAPTTLDAMLCRLTSAAPHSPRWRSFASRWPAQRLCIWLRRRGASNSVVCRCGRCYASPDQEVTTKRGTRTFHPHTPRPSMSRLRDVVLGASRLGAEDAHELLYFWGIDGFRVDAHDWLLVFLDERPGGALVIRAVCVAVLGGLHHVPGANSGGRATDHPVAPPAPRRRTRPRRDPAAAAAHPCRAGIRLPPAPALV